MITCPRGGSPFVALTKPRAAKAKYVHPRIEVLNLGKAWRDIQSDTFICQIEFRLSSAGPGTTFGVVSKHISRDNHTSDFFARRQPPPPPGAQGAAL
jgi:hypothetical protein